MIETIMSTLLSGLQNPALAAVYGAIFTTIAFYIREEKFSKPKQKQREQSKLANALEVELESFYELYIRNKLPCEPEKVGNSYTPPVILPLSKNNIYIYLENAVNIGLFESADAKIIISFYNQIMGLIETSHELSKRWSEYAKANRKYMAVSSYNRRAHQASVAESEWSKDRDSYLHDFENLYPTVIRYQDNVLNNYESTIKILKKYIRD